VNTRKEIADQEAKDALEDDFLARAKYPPQQMLFFCFDPVNHD
jgi:hypothetical protein